MYTFNIMDNNGDSNTQIYPVIYLLHSQHTAKPGFALDYYFRDGCVFC